MLLKFLMNLKEVVNILNEIIKKYFEVALVIKTALDILYYGIFLTAVYLSL